MRLITTAKRLTSVSWILLHTANILLGRDAGLSVSFRRISWSRYTRKKSQECVKKMKPRTLERSGGDKTHSM